MMNRILPASVGLVLCLEFCTGDATGRRAQPPGERDRNRDRAEKLFTDRNYPDAFEAYRAFALDPKDAPDRIGPDLKRAIECLAYLGREDEVDALCDTFLAIHPGTWRWRQAVAEMYLTELPHFGYLVAGRFERYPRGGFQAEREVGAYERDRSRVLQLLSRGLDRATTDPDHHAAGVYLLTLARALMGTSATYDCWRLQNLTPLDALDDYDRDSSRYLWSGRPRGAAPVEPDGTPVYYRVPESFAAAGNDGERWRWALTRAAQVDPSLIIGTRLELAGFLLSQFGTQTITEWASDIDVDKGPGGIGPETLAALRDDETVARLANGIRRFTLPDSFNPIKIYQSLADDPSSGKVEQALNGLAAIFENRRQLDRAVIYLEKSRALHGNGNDGWKQKRLDQMLKPWGDLEGSKTQVAGRLATVGFRFRNGRRAHIEAREVLLGKLLKAQKTDLSDLGPRLVKPGQSEFLGRSVAGWDLDLEPAPGHLDKRITVTTPLESAGAYLLIATMEGGNTSRIVFLLDDTVIVKKALDRGNYYFVADARTGQPVARADVELFGWRQVPANAKDGANRNASTPPVPPIHDGEMMIGAGPVVTGPQVPPAVDKKDEDRVETVTLELKTDDQGQVQVPASQLKAPEDSYRWLVTARTADGRIARLGFVYAWSLGNQEFPRDQFPVHTFVITDRPVYRPGSRVHFKLWIARPSYPEQVKSAAAGNSVTVEIKNPRWETVFTGKYATDAFGGIDGSFELPANAMLGDYGISTEHFANGWFRVEEYKKPEFEVTVAGPAQALVLGDKVTATIRANYYFGGPVAQGIVKYKVARTPADLEWYPPDRWDWLFGPGYWWFGAEAPWYPGWSRWRMPKLRPHWWDRPEVVAATVAPLGPDGTLAVEIDTAGAQAAHPDEDQRYEITALVTDSSRRTVAGTGTVLVARQPFRVCTWLDRGHYRVGGTMQANVSAQALGRQPITGKGTLKLLKISYDEERRPVETSVESWDLALAREGQAHQAIKAAAAGQYRLATTIDDGKGHVLEGGYLFTVAGQGADTASFRFNDLELIPERKEYRPGETVRLMINTDRVNATVLLFVRPANGVYPPPKVIQLRGKCTVEEIGIVAGDRPNIFVEGVTVADGKVHEVVREIAVPPESPFVDIAVEPSQTTYKPGAKAKVKLQLTVPAVGTEGLGRTPFVGSTVLTVYDKALEYIVKEGSVPADIKEIWSWTREHYAHSQSSFDRWLGHASRQNEVQMQRPPLFFGLSGTGELLSERPADEHARQIEYSLVITRAGSLRQRAAAAAAARPGPVIRSNFADTAFWAGALTTATDGTVFVEFTLPESLTTWKIKCWAMGSGARVGQSETEVVTTKDLLVRLQAPRFFVEKDEVVLSANVHNRTKTRITAAVVLELEGSVLAPLGETSRTVEVAAGSEQRVDWRVKVAHEGEAVIRMKALSDLESDAAQMSFPAYIHGMRKTEAFTGTLRPDEEKAQVVMRVPSERKPEQSRLAVRYSPSLAGALVDALPYLADYPYGCTEQTLNRFLATVITQKVLLNLGLNLKAIRDQHTNLNAQQLGEARQRGRTWSACEHNPVFDEAEVSKMAAAGMWRLGDMQLADGGWGWFSGSGEIPSAHLTALVVHGLQVAQINGLKPPDGRILQRGVEWLTDYQARQTRLIDHSASESQPFKRFADDTDALVFMVLTDAGVCHDKMLARLERDRSRLSVYAQALFGLALERLGQKEKLTAVLQNIARYVVRDDQNQTAYLTLPNENYRWSWYGDEIETDAFYLKLLARTDPKGELAPRLVRYLINSRRHGRYWRSTRDTAYCIEALADYLKASGEDRPDMTVTIAIDGETKTEVKIAPADLFHFDNGLTLEGTALATGEHTVSVVKRGRGPLYYNAYLTNFTLEDPIGPVGLEIKVDRKVYRLVRDDKVAGAPGSRGQIVAERVERFRRELLADGATLRSGELVEVELDIVSKNDYEYLLFEDHKAAGFEPVEFQSGYNGNDLGAYVEFRDDRVAFFVRTLARGEHSVSYRLRAVVPGRFHALPARAQAMYAPELSANTGEIQLEVKD
jgi:alpha-2-macroglobulin